jgi:carbon-monoxide dehydrogenase medium subunit
MGEYHVASSVEEALEKLSRCEGRAEIVAGGQTMMLLIRQGLVDPDLLVDISKITEIRGIEDVGEYIEIGSATTYAEIKESPLIEKEFGFYTMATSEISGPQVRNQGTIGGGLVYGDPALDTPPVLLTLDAELEIQNAQGSRRILLEDFFVDYYETAIEEGEILTKIIIPKLPKHSGGKYRAMTPRQGDYAIAGVCVRLTLDENGICIVARVGLTNGGDTPMRSKGAEKVLEGTKIEEETIENAVEILGKNLDLIGDIQTPKSYKEIVFKRIARQTIKDVKLELMSDA